MKKRSVLKLLTCQALLMLALHGSAYAGYIDEIPSYYSQVSREQNTVKSYITHEEFIKYAYLAVEVETNTELSDEDIYKYKNNAFEMIHGLNGFEYPENLEYNGNDIKHIEILRSGNDTNENSIKCVGYGGGNVDNESCNMWFNNDTLYVEFDTKYISIENDTYCNELYILETLKNVESVKLDKYCSKNIPDFFWTKEHVDYYWEYEYGTVVPEMQDWGPASSNWGYNYGCTFNKNNEKYCIGIENKIPIDLDESYLDWLDIRGYLEEEFITESIQDGYVDLDGTMIKDDLLENGESSKVISYEFEIGSKYSDYRDIINKKYFTLNIEVYLDSDNKLHAKALNTSDIDFSGIVKEDSPAIINGYKTYRKLLQLAYSSGNMDSDEGGLITNIEWADKMPEEWTDEPTFNGPLLLLSKTDKFDRLDSNSGTHLSENSIHCVNIGNGPFPIWAWYDPYKKVIKMYTKQKDIKLDSDCRDTFSGLKAITNLNFLERVGLQEGTRTEGMFYDCTSLTDIKGIRHWFNIENVGKIGELAELFKHVPITNIDDLQGVPYPADMFIGAFYDTKITSLDLSKLVVLKYGNNTGETGHQTLAYDRLDTKDDEVSYYIKCMFSDRGLANDIYIEASDKPVSNNREAPYNVTKLSPPLQTKITKADFKYLISNAGWEVGYSNFNSKVRNVDELYEEYSEYVDKLDAIYNEWKLEKNIPDKPDDMSDEEYLSIYGDIIEKEYSKLLYSDVYKPITFYKESSLQLKANIPVELVDKEAPIGNFKIHNVNKNTDKVLEVGGNSGDINTINLYNAINDVRDMYGNIVDILRIKVEKNDIFNETQSILDGKIEKADKTHGSYWLEVFADVKYDIFEDTTNINIVKFRCIKRSDGGNPFIRHKPIIGVPDGGNPFIRHKPIIGVPDGGNPFIRHKPIIGVPDGGNPFIRHKPIIGVPDDVNYTIEEISVSELGLTEEKVKNILNAFEWDSNGNVDIERSSIIIADSDFNIIGPTNQENTLIKLQEAVLAKMEEKGINIAMGREPTTAEMTDMIEEACEVLEEAKGISFSIDKKALGELFESEDGVPYLYIDLISKLGVLYSYGDKLAVGHFLGINERFKASDAGTVEYTITQIPGDDDSVIWDNIVFHMTVDVAKDEETNALSLGAYIDNIKINNIRRLKVDEFINVTSENEAIPLGKFEVLDEDGKVINTLEVKEGKIEFKQYYSKDDIGEHKYIIRQVPGNSKGVIYDNTEWEVVINVYEDTANENTVLRLRYDGSFPNIIVNNLSKATSSEIIRVDVTDKLTESVDETFNDSEVYTIFNVLEGVYNLFDEKFFTRSLKTQKNVDKYRYGINKSNLFIDVEEKEESTDYSMYTDKGIKNIDFFIPNEAQEELSDDGLIDSKIRGFSIDFTHTRGGDTKGNGGKSTPSELEKSTPSEIPKDKPSEKPSHKPGHKPDKDGVATGSEIPRGKPSEKPSKKPEHKPSHKPSEKPEYTDEFCNDTNESEDKSSNKNRTGGVKKSDTDNDKGYDGDWIDYDNHIMNIEKGQPAFRRSDGTYLHDCTAVLPERGRRGGHYDTYVFDHEGHVRVGWIKDHETKQWYYHDEDGRRLYGWQTINGKNYFFFDDMTNTSRGIMLHDTVIDGHRLGSDGAEIAE